MPSLMHRRSHHSMKRFYDWVHRYYGSIEESIGPALDSIIEGMPSVFADAGSKTALDYACGSGLLTLKLARRFSVVDGRDASTGMIGRAMERANALSVFNASFRAGDIMEPDEAPGSYDIVFVSFALHLFHPDVEREILRKLFAIATEAVVVIDHGRRWSAKTALIEWIEGSYYDRFITLDFNAMANEIGVSRFVETEIADSLVLEFCK